MPAEAGRGGIEMYLHKDREIFKDMVGQASDSSGRTPAVVEKDYYVTLILKLLSDQLAECVLPCDRPFFGRYRHHI